MSETTGRAGPNASVNLDALAAPKPAPGFLSRTGYWAFLAIAGVARALPLETASDVSGWLWRVIAPRLRRHRRALDNLAASMPELSYEQREAILLDVWETLGRTFAEAFHLGDIAADPSRIALELPDAVRTALASERGCVIASLHAGNWELCAVAAMQLGLPVAGVYQRLKNTLVDDAVTAMRRPFYPLGLFSKGHDTVVKLMRIGRSGGSIAVLADLREHKGIEVAFFGRPAPSTPFPALMARAMNVPLVAVRMIRKDRVRFVLTGELVPVPRSSRRDEDVREATAALQAAFERFIREHPGQWMWGHRRWAR